MIFTAWFCPLNIISLLSPQLSPCAPSLGSSPALALSTCLNLANFFLSASCFIDLYGVILSMEGKDFFDTPKTRLGTEPQTAFVWCGQFRSHSIPWVFKQLQISELKTSELVHPPSPESAQAFFKKVFNSLSCTSLNGGHIISRALSSSYKGKTIKLRTDLGTGLQIKVKGTS